MCGIAGVVGGAGGGDGDLVRRMCSALRHRGPDDEGIFTQPGVALGMRRLAIVGVDSGAQPMSSSDGKLTVVFNGEIYNFPELREQLGARGHVFRTASDTECILHLYEESGTDCVAKLRGMFAFALWDAPNQQLFLARDRVGKKPLYYRFAAGGIAFSSELKALTMDPTFHRSVDHRAIHHYLTLQYVPAPHSIYEGVCKLPPAHVLVFRDGKASVRRYWSLDYGSKLLVSREEAADLVRSKIREATRARMYAERPLGAFLSGGVDSSVVVAAMAENSSRAVKTFTIGFPDADFDERPFARLVAQRFGTEHHEFVVDESVENLLPVLAWYYDEPFADSSAVPTYYVAGITSREVTVALNGDGGDEGFAGYDRYVAMSIAHKIGIPPAMGGLLLRLANQLSRGSWAGTRRIARFADLVASPPDDRYARLMAYFTPTAKADLYTKDMIANTAGFDTFDLIRDVFAASTGESLVDKLLDVDVQTYLPGDLLVKVDIASMAHSLEARSPLLDHELLELAASLPADLKLVGRSGKVALKAAARGWLPDEVLDRPKKGFGVPLSRWLQTDLAAMSRELLLDRTARERNYFEPRRVEALLEEHHRTGNHGPRIWALLMLELWHRTWIDPPVAPATPPRP